MYLNFSRKPIPTRNGFGDALLQLGKNNKIFALCADLTESIRIHKFKEKYPEQYVEMGVAEQNLVTVASGLAAIGKIPFAASYAAFCPGRCWEQIRTTICYNNQNVKLVGAHAGITVGPDGATHQALEDIATMRSLPNMVVVLPCDYEQAIKATKALAKFKGPTYLRLTRPKTAQMTTKKTPFVLGKAQVFRSGTDIALIGAGPLVYECLEVAKLLEKKGLKAMVINCHTIKPLDKKTVLAAAKKCKKIVTVEEAQINGGLGGAVAEFLSETYPTKMLRVGILDEYGESGEPQELLERFGLSTQKIYQKVWRWVKR